MGSHHLTDRPSAARVAARLLGSCAPHTSPADALAQVAATLAARREMPADDGHAVHLGDGLFAALVLGAAYEQLLAPAERRTRGAHFTPFDVAGRLVAFALGEEPVDSSFRGCDPTCGGGVFLLALGAALEARGWPRARAAAALHGADIDPLGVWVTRTSLALWAGNDDPSIEDRVVEADALTTDPWQIAAFDAVVGNPPFQNQLERSTVRTGASRRAGDALGAARAPYADTAALFLVRSIALVRDGGRVALIQPQSTLVARDAAPARALVREQAAVVGLWYATDAIFAASVRVCAPVLVRHVAPRPDAAEVTRAQDRFFAPVAPRAMPAPGETWAGLVSDLLGIPAVALRGDRRVGDIATATAGFRDEYYGLVGSVAEGDASTTEPRLLTCGLIDLLDCAWGVRTATFARVRYTAPIVHIDQLGGRVGSWVAAQLVPKVLVATQTKVIETVVDERGVYVPSTPVIAVHAHPNQLWHLAAALSAPCVSAHAFARHAGAALGAQALKLAARQVLDLPLPIDHAKWDQGAQLARSVHASIGVERTRALDRFGVVMNEAYGVTSPDVLAWWSARR